MRKTKAQFKTPDHPPPREDTLQLVEPITMDQTLIENLPPPRLEPGKRLLLAGLGERYSGDASAAIPSQWQRFPLEK